MREALIAAELAAKADEVPVGAVLVGSDEIIIAAAGNRTIRDNDPTAHAEILVLREAGKILNNYRLTDTTLYTTVEPCVMCAGALVNARIGRLVFGTHDLRFGGVETRFRLCDGPELNHRIEIVSGILAEECRLLMQDFFREKRAST